MSFDPNQRVVSANARLESLVKEQTAVLHKILERLDEIADAVRKQPPGEVTADSLKII